MTREKIAIIGGSGLEKLELQKDAEIINLETPYGKTSSPIFKSTFPNLDVHFLSRHGLKHQYSPTKVNNRANIWALKELDCTKIIATTAVGSLREEIKPGHLVFPDQFIDFTRFRDITFFDDFKDGEVKHTAMADPFDSKIREELAVICKSLAYDYHSKGTVLTIEGPRFSTRVESHMFRAWGADLINMSTAPEAALANELEIPYAAIAMSTDYDCWKSDIEAVSMEAIFKVFKANAEKVVQLLKSYFDNYTI
ncbi:MAG: S-methyl-5'-thioadenosine phosphorylase [Bacteroidales bacterium]|jgi:5'-methylthioadenosine phosphorylase|nr:S-methyl-5'-thioadenosine phosphorylase [Bacteroidales bacterium]